MESGTKRSRKSKLVPRDIADSDDEIVELQNEVERTLSRYKSVPIVRSLRPPAPLPSHSPSPPPTTSAPPMELSVKVEVENVDEEDLIIETEPAQVYDVDDITCEEIMRESQNIVNESKNICDKILHIQVLNECNPEPKKFTKTNQEKLLDKALLRWRDWACFTEENKEPPLFYKCYVCQMSWWHLHQFREHLQIHTFKSLRVNIEINDYVECSIVAYVDRLERKFIDLDGKCWRCGEVALEHVKPRYCLGCKKRTYTCTKHQEHQWYCDQFKQMHIKLFQKATKILKCHLCRMYYFKSGDLWEHMMLRHTVRSDLPISWDNDVCNLCNSPVSIGHVCKQQVFQECCQMCKKRFTNKNMMSIHRFMWKNSKSCPMCNISLKRECMLVDHILLHTEKYSLMYRCLICPKFVLLLPTMAEHHTLEEHKNYLNLEMYSPYDPIYIPTVIGNKMKKNYTDDTPDTVKVHVKSKVLYCEVPSSQKIKTNNSDRNNISQNTQEVAIESDLSIVKTEPNDIEYMDVDDDVIILDSCPETIDDHSGDDQSNAGKLPCVITNIKTEPENEAIDGPVIVKTEAIEEIDDINIENNVDNAEIGPHDIDKESNCNDKPKLIKTYSRKSKAVKSDLKSSKQNDVETNEDAGKSQNETCSKQCANIQNDEADMNEGSQNILTCDQIKKEHDPISILTQDNCSVTQNVASEDNIKTTIKETLINVTNAEKNIKDSTNKVDNEENVTGDGKNIKNTSDMSMNINAGSDDHNLENVQIAIENVNETDIMNKKTINKKPSKIENEVNTEVEVPAIKSNIQMNMSYDKDLKIKKEPLTETEADLKLEDIKKIYHIDVNLSADPTDNVNVKQEIKEIDMREQGKDTWDICGGVFENFNEPETEEDFESDLIIIEPKQEMTVASDEPESELRADSEPEERDIRNRKRKLYKCKRCSFQGYHKSYSQHKRDSCPLACRLRPQEFTDYACSKCLIRFESLRHYLRHFYEHDYPRLTCPKCLHVSRNMFNLEMHVFAHVKSTFITYRSINSPEETRKCAYRCKVCERHVVKTQFFQHWDSHVELRDWREVDSGELVKTRDPGVQKIIELFTNTEKLNDMTRRNFRSCVICDRDFNRRNDCKRHMIEHLLTDAYKMKFHYPDLRCQICDKGFQKTEGYRSHMRNHASLPVYKCEICNKTFSDSSNFSKHKKVHNFSILICDICAKKFNNKMYLIRHIKFHETQKPIKCEHCEKIFFSQSQYRKHHLNAHEPTLPRFKCRQCTLAFHTLREKWDHMWNLHNERKSEADCPLCTAKFRKISDVRRHLEKEHGVSLRESRNAPGYKPKTYPAKQA